MNVTTMIGNLTRDIEITYTPGGFPIGKFSLALNDRRKKGEQWEDVVHYVDVTVLGSTAENLAQYLTKGKKIGVTAKVQQDRWTDKNTGQNRSKVYFLAHHIDLLSPKTEGQGYQGAPQQGGYQGAPVQNAAPQGAPAGYQPQAGPGAQVPPIGQPAPVGAPQQGNLIAPQPPSGSVAPPHPGFQDDYPQ